MKNSINYAVRKKRVIEQLKQFRLPSEPNLYDYKIDYADGHVCFSLVYCLNVLKHRQVMFCNFEAFPKRIGIGSRCLEYLTRLADDHQLNLVLDIHKFELELFYKRFGFEVTGETEHRRRMKRRPRVQEMPQCA